MSKIGFIFSIALAVVMAAGTTASARTWYIKPDGSGDAPTIQAGITAAGTGDIVLLAAGTYTGVGNRDIDFLGKAITVTSESGRNVTIIDCQGVSRGFVFQSGEGPSSVLSGVTVRNGHGSVSCGGICCSESSPTILNNTISGNSALWGGGIYCYISSASISGNLITGNSAGNSGGGIYCWESSPTISNNTLSGNSTTFGGGICFYSSSGSISDNLITGNSAGNGGGGIYCIDGSSPTISGNTMSGNFTTFGGGICYYGSSGSISGNLITGNSAGNGGGGIYCIGDSSLTISGNTISGNSTVFGGGICYYSSSGSISGNLITGNSADNGGGGIYCIDDSSLTISGNTISGNSGVFGGGIQCQMSGLLNISNTIIAFSTSGQGIYCDEGSGGSLTLSNCDLYGNTGGDALCGTDGGGNICANPLFCDSLRSDSLYIRSDSPCAPGNNASGELIGAWPVGCEAPTSVRMPTSNAPAAYAAYQSYPNPFNPVCRIRYDIPVAGMVRLQIFDVSGSAVRTLVDAWREPGLYGEQWDGKADDGSTLPSGVYFYSLKAGDFVSTHKMVLLK